MSNNDALGIAVRNATQLSSFIQSSQVSRKKDVLLYEGIDNAETNKYWNTETSVAVKTDYVGSYRAYPPITVKEGEVITLIGWAGSSPKQYPIIFVDGDYKILSHSDRPTGSSYVTQAVVAPSGSKYVLINVYSDAGKIYKIFSSDISNDKSNKFNGLTMAIIGDSISTNGNTGLNANVPEITITTSDVGISLSAYLTSYDVAAGLSLGGYTYISGEIGTEVTFTPTADDVGKVIGLSNNYNNNSDTVWWENVCDSLGMNAIPVCWSGASISSHESTSDLYKTSYAWHDAQIRKCGTRIQGSMTRIAPDIITIARGINDFSHTPYTLLTTAALGTYPANDTVNTSDFGFKEALMVTVSKLRSVYPYTKIFICTLETFKRVNYTAFPVNNGINNIPEYNKAIREVADFLGCDIIEFDKCGITFENCHPAYLSDSTTPAHPNRQGHIMLGNRAINDLISKY